MEETVFKGVITYINFEKNFATIEYHKGAKLKSVNCKTGQESGRKTSHFRVGDTVSFRLKLSDRGDKQTAYQVKFLHNTRLDLLVQKAAIENRFAGYLKKLDGRYYVKEADSYIFFPLQLSPWEKPPVETAENELISFRLLHTDHPNSMVAELFSHNFSAAYKKALQHYKNEISTEAVVSRVSPHAVYLDLFDGGMQAKLSLSKTSQPPPAPGDTLQVMISYLAPDKLVVKPLEQVK